MTANKSAAERLRELANVELYELAGGEPSAKYQLVESAILAAAEAVEACEYYAIFPGNIHAINALAKLDEVLK